MTAATTSWGVAASAEGLVQWDPDNGDPMSWGPGSPYSPGSANDPMPRARGDVLITEIMFFGGLFAAYTVYRSQYHDAFAAAAQAKDLSFTCAAGGGLVEWELCLVAADGVLAVVPFNSEPGLVARVSQPRLSRDVLVPLDTNQLVGIQYTGLQATLDIEYLGETIVGRMSAPPPQPGG